MIRSSRFDIGPTNQPRSAAFLLLITIASTTLRVFVPTIGGICLGVILDRSLTTGIVWTIAMFIVGSSVSILFIRQQLKNVKKYDK